MGGGVWSYALGSSLIRLGQTDWCSLKQLGAQLWPIGEILFFVKSVTVQPRPEENTAPEGASADLYFLKEHNT